MFYFIGKAKGNRVGIVSGVSVRIRRYRSNQSINQSITSIGMERRAKIAEGKPRAEDVGMICRDDSLGNIGEGSEGQFRCLSMCDAGGGEERGFAECK